MWYSSRGSRESAETRLADELIDLARAKGATVFAGAAEEMERAWPFRTLSNVFDLRLDSSWVEGRELARMLHAPRDAPENPVQIAPELPSRVAEAIESRAWTAAAQGPVVVVVDDAQWADAASLAVVGSIARRVRDLALCVVVTYRPDTDHPQLDRFLDALVRGGAMQLNVEPLDADAMSALAAEALGAPPGPNLLEQLAGAAGNPLYALELVRTLAEEGDIDTAGGVAEFARPGPAPRRPGDGDAPALGAAEGHVRIATNGRGPRTRVRPRRVGACERPRYGRARRADRSRSACGRPH